MDVVAAAGPPLGAEGAAPLQAGREGSGASGVALAASAGTSGHLAGAAVAMLQYFGSHLQLCPRLGLSRICPLDHWIDVLRGDRCQTERGDPGLHRSAVEPRLRRHDVMCCACMAKRMSAAALMALEEALTNVYWYKDGLKKFLYRCLGRNSALVSGSDWTDNKRTIVSRIVCTLAADQDRHLEKLRTLCIEVCAFDEFPHLADVEDAPRKVAKAKAAVTELRRLAGAHLKADEERAEIERRTKTEAERMKRLSSMAKGLSEVRRAFAAAFSLKEQARGYELEKILYDLLALFDMDPKASFKVVGEQIDGAFVFEGTDYIVEARWTDKLSTRDEIDVFSAKVERRLDNTLGLFISINGLTDTALTKGGTGRMKILAMTGEDLNAVLEDRIGLPDLLRRKRRYGVQTGEMLLKVSEILSAG